MRKLVLVTGGAGFIGSHLVDKLLEQGERVICLDDFNDFYDPGIKRKNIRPHLDDANFQVIPGDIRNLETLKKLFKDFPVKKIVHLAARTGVRLSLENPLLYEDVNIKGTLHLLEMARLYEVEQFIFASSSSVYGANMKVPFSEDDPIKRTISPYAATKYAGELMCYTYSHLYNIPTTCLRFFTVYGPRQRPDLAIHKFTKFFYEGWPISLFGQGDSARDYTYVDDIIQGITASLKYSFPFEVFNLGESFPISLRQLIHYLEEIFDDSICLKFLPPQPGDVEITCADITKARSLLGYNPQICFKDGLKSFVQWYKEQYNVVIKK